MQITNRQIVARPMLAIRAVAWTQDEVTGYMIPKDDPSTGTVITNQGDGRLRHDGFSLALMFTPEMKIKMVEILPKHWPNITAACDEIGITRQSYTAHLAIDEKFRNDIQTIVDRKIDEVEQRFFEMGKRPKNYMDRITVARAYRPEVYDPAKKLEISVNRREMSDAEAQELAGKAAGYVDAEIVQEQYSRGAKPEIPGAVGLDDEAVNRKDVPTENK